MQGKSKETPFKYLQAYRFYSLSDLYQYTNAYDESVCVVGIKIIKNTSALAERANRKSDGLIGKLKLALGKHQQPLPCFLGIRSRLGVVGGYREGYFDLEVRINTTRLLEIGFLADPEGNLLIFKSQRHLLGSSGRKLIPLYQPELEREKNMGDYYIRKIKDDTGLNIEIFGLLTAAFFFGNLIDGKDILFPCFEAHPQIAQRLQRMNQERENDDSQETDLIVRNLSDEIEGMREMVDFQVMLERIGVNRESIITKYPHLRVPLGVIEMAYHYNFTDDSPYPNRFRYRSFFEELRGRS